MYRFLCTYLPEQGANIMMLLWYLLLCVLIFVLSLEPDAGFLYLAL